MKGEGLTRAVVLSAFVVVMAGVCPGSAEAQEAVLTDNSTILAAKPKAVPSAASQHSLRVVGPLNARAECDALLKFDLSTLPAGTANTNILKATLILYVNTLARSGTFDVVSVGEAWNEQTVTWAKAPALLQMETAGVVPVEGQFVTVDLTELVKNWVDGTITNNGIAIVPNASSVNVSFDSKESTTTSHQPQLVIATSQNVSILPNDAGYVTATVTNAVAQTNATYSGMSVGTATFAVNSASLGDLSTSGWSNFVTAVTNGLPDANAMAGKANTNQNISLFPNDAAYVTKAVTNGLPDANAMVGKATTNLFSGSNTGLVFNTGAPDLSMFLREDGSWAPTTNGFAYLNDLNATNAALRLGPLAVTNGLPDANAMVGKASTNLFSGSNTGLVFHVGVPDPTKFLREDGTWAPAGGTNGFVYMSDLWATNDAIRLGPLAVTNGLPDANAMVGKAATNQNISLFPNDAAYVTKAVTNGLPDANAMVGKASTNLFSGSNTGLVFNVGAPDLSKFLREDGSWAPTTNGFAYLSDLNATNAAIRLGPLAVTNGLPDANAMAGKASTNLFSGSNTGLVFNVGAPDLTKFLREDGSWAPTTNGFAYLNDLNATNNAIRIGPQAVTNGLADANAMAGKAATNQNVSLFPNDAAYVTKTVTNAVAQTNATYSGMSVGTASFATTAGSINGSAVTATYAGMSVGTATFATTAGSLNGSGATATYPGMSVGTATFAANSASLGNLAAAGWSNFVTAVTNGLPNANTLAGKANTNQNVSLFPNDAAYVTKAVTNGLPDANAMAGKAATNQNISLFPNNAAYVTMAVTNGLPDANALAGKAATNRNVSLFPNDAGYVTITVTNGLPDANAMVGKASTNLFSGSNTGLVFNAGAPDLTKFLRQDGSWAPTTNGFAYLNDLNATNNAIRIGPQAVTNGLADANAMAGKAATNQNVSLFPNDAAYVTATVTNAVAQTNGTYSGMSAGTATFAANSGNLGNLSTSGWSNLVNSITNGLPDATTLDGKAGTNQNISLFPNNAGYVTAIVTNALPDVNALASKAATNQNVSLFPNDAGYVTATVTNGLPDANALASVAATNQNVSLFPNDAGYVTAIVTNGLPDANTLASKASTNIFSGSNTGLVANAGAPDPTKFLRQDGVWTAPAGATNGLSYLSDLNATNDALRIGPQAVTNGLPDANALAGAAATNQNISLFPNDAGYVTTTVTNGLPDADTLAGKADTNQDVSLFPNDAGYVTMDVTNGLETIAAANAFAPTNSAPSALTNATFVLGVNFTNGNFRCFYTVSVGLVSTTVVDFINLTDGTTNTVSVADAGGLILTNSVFQFAGPNEVFVINTNRSAAGQAPSLISVMGKIQ